MPLRDDRALASPNEMHRPLRLRRVLLWHRRAICAMFMTLLSGCGQSPYQPPLRPVAYPEEESPAAARVKTAAKSEQTAVRAVHTVAPSKIELPDGAIVDPGADTNRKHIPREFPADLGQWLSEDFQRARELRNFRLKEAVRELAPGNEYNPDADLNARLLAKLLDAPPMPATAPSQLHPASRGYDDFDETVQGPATQMPGLAAAIVEALGSNGSAEARLVLKQILLGKQHSDVDDRALAVAALRTLIDHQDEENQKILLAVLTVPDSIRPAGRGQLTPDQLHEDCLRLVRPIATPQFRLKLAQRACRGISSPATRQRLNSMLLVPDRANAPAQVELITNGQIDATAMPVLERQLGQAAQQVLDQLLGGRAAIANRSGRSSSPVTLDSDSDALSSH